MNQQAGKPTSGVADEKQQLKRQGLAFGRSLQTVLKTVIMYSVDHQAVGRGLEQAFSTLTALAKQTGQFTFGFLNHRVLVGNLLTDDSSLGQLEAEFTRRGVGAVAFSAGITLRDFRRVLALLSLKPQVLEEKGGIRTLFHQDPIPGVRIIPVRKRTSEDEDLSVSMDADAYQLAQEILGPAGGGSGAGLDMLCQASGVEKPATAVSQPGAAMGLINRAVQLALTSPEVDPRGVLQALMMWLAELTPDFLLPALSPTEQVALRGRPVPDVATELVENAVITAAVQRLTAPGEGLPLPAREEDVARLLSRGLRATQVAERLLRKLGHFLREAGLPPEVYEELRQSLAWYALAPQQQREQLLQLRSFSGQTFRRLVGYARDRMNEGEPHQALEVAEHYFDCLFAAPDDIQGTELARAPELLNVVTGLPALNFLRKMAEELRRRLGNGTSHTEHHAQVVSCLVALAHALAPYEDFETIHKIGTDLETLVEQDSTRHSQCCRAALGELSTPTALQRLVELLLASRDDPATARIVTALLQWVGSAAVDRLFEQLEAETVAPNRMRLMRLIAQYGQVATDAARKRLRDQRWYVVRNACRILGDLECPDLPALLRDSLRHSDARVQMAAAEAVMGSTDQSRFRVLSEVLSSLDGAVLDLVLDEIMLQRDPGCVEGITELLSSHREYKAFTLEKAVRVLAAIPADSALHALAGVARDSVLPASVRDAAKHALAQSSAPLARGLLAKL